MREDLRIDDQDDRTVMRPTPGGRMRSAAPAPAEPATASADGLVRPTPGRRREPAQGAARPTPPPPAGAPLHFEARLALNPLVEAAATLLAVLGQIRGAVHHPHVPGLYRRLIDELRDFDTQCRDQKLSPAHALAGRYLLCTVLDEAVLHTPWGDQSSWAQRTLLSVSHNETSGGEKCFAILQQLLREPGANVDALELFYLCLAQGFEGRYRLLHRGREQLDSVREDLYRTIRAQRGDFERGLSPRWRGLGQVRKSLAQYLPLWVVASVLGALLLAGYAGFNTWLRAESEPVLTQLQALSEANDPAAEGAPRPLSPPLEESTP